MSAFEEQTLKRTGGFLFALLLLIMLPAWSLSFWQGWLYWLVFSACTLGITFYFLKHDPELIERRARAGAGAEKEKIQKIIQAILSVFSVALLVFPGFDHRFGWSEVPNSVVFIANALVALGFLTVFVTFQTNSYASAIIEVGESQPVISNGPYALVRHPMYVGALFLFAATPLALGSVWGLLLAVPVIACIGWRLIEEEKYLAVNLPGYKDYLDEVPYRLVPFIW
jgi:protein-S-isoprenylcysteine O-methyltransferase Ste14